MKPDDDPDVPDSPSTSGVHRAQPDAPRLPAPSPRVLVLERDVGLLETLPRYLPGPYRHRVVSSISEAFSAMAQASAPYGGLIT
ncbi:MAG: hypothetical protein DRJ42_18010, partial [Deltaproteobacteria bacterium]